MIRLVAVIAAAVVLALAVFIVLSFSDDDPALAPTDSPTPLSRASISATAGATASPAVPSRTPPSEVNALYRADAARPEFVGTIAGIEIFGPEMTFDPWPCAWNMEPVYEDFAAMPFRLSNPPVGTTEERPTLWLCGEDDSVLRASRSYRGVGTGLGISFFAGLTSFTNDNLKAERVSEGDVNGVLALFAEPLSSDGWGSSTILWRTDNGLMRVYAIDVPFDVVLNVAEAVDCFAC